MPDDTVALVEDEDLAVRAFAKAQVGARGRLLALRDVLLLDQLSSVFACPLSLNRIRRIASCPPFGSLSALT